MLSLREFAGIAGVAITAMVGAMTASALHLWPQAPQVASVVESKPAQAFVVAPAPQPNSVVAHVEPAKPVAPTVTVIRGRDLETDKVLPPEGAVAEPPPPPQQVTLDPAIVGQQAGEVAARLQSEVPSALVPYFDVFLYVSKSAEGAWAQHMYVFHKNADGTLVLDEAFLVSTGREQHERYFTSTPTGMFELDPNRFERTHYSHRWHGAAMPWAMFLNYQIHSGMTGVALHARVDGEEPVGERASGGCVRMPIDKAEELFKRFQAEEYGRVPVFAFDYARNTTSIDGTIMKDAAGNPLLTDGYKVLLVIEDYPGGPALVATIS